MNRSARGLLRTSVLGSLVAALAVAAAPTEAVPAKAAPSAAAGPSTQFLYEATAAGRGVMRTLPAPAAELGTGAVDGALRAAPAGPGLRTAGDRGPGAALPGLSGGAGDIPGTLLGGSLGKGLSKVGVGKGLPTGKLLRTGEPAQTEAAGSVLPNARAAEAPISMAGPVPLPGLKDLRSLLGAASPGSLPVGQVLFPPSARRSAASPPSGDLLGQVDGAVSKARGLGQTEGQVVDVLKARERRSRGNGDGPLSMPNASALGLPKVSGLPKLSGLPVVSGRG
ncbi:hypothetical protein [Actinomadura sp. WMMA1423]|uniref:hypothetical protein n=1 Tax=Actinomadura sp. WMMA1423 TaxID=2591108 RepID=UPI0011462A21|nr:hypothetical protein [Actinomadura sp. WMMA1423]